jgi:TM2 domain-containing membrane protein YozV
MPSIGAGLAALLAGWMVDGLLQPYLGTGVTFLLSFALSTVIFFAARRWLLELRGR